MLRREYNKTVVRVGIEKARAIPREEAIKRAERSRKGNKGEEGGRQHRLIVEYDRTGPKLREVL